MNYQKTNEHGQSFSNNGFCIYNKLLTHIEILFLELFM